jgi:hypothetical protein
MLFIWGGETLSKSTVLLPASRRVHDLCLLFRILLPQGRGCQLRSFSGGGSKYSRWVGLSANRLLGSDGNKELVMSKVGGDGVCVNGLLPDKGDRLRRRDLIGRGQKTAEHRLKVVATNCESPARCLPKSIM